MKKLLLYLKQPFPISENYSMVVVLSTLIVVFILAVFEPFGFHLYRGNKVFALVGFGLATAAGTSVACYIFPHIFKTYYDGENWTVGKNFIHNLLVLILISLSNSLFFLLLTKQSWDGFPYILSTFLPFTVLVGIFPIILISILIQNNALKQNLKEAKEINTLLAQKAVSTEKTESEETEFLTIEGNTKEALTLSADMILYLEASGNYVNVNYWEDNRLKKKLIRETLSQLDEQLKPYLQFIRCHRAYIVNTNRIETISGNSQGYKLNLHNISQDIPVSRSYIKVFKERIS